MARVRKVVPVDLATRSWCSTIRCGRRSARGTAGSGNASECPGSRRLLVPDSAALRAWFTKLSNVEGLTRVIPGHGLIVTQDARGVLQRVAAANLSLR